MHVISFAAYRIAFISLYAYIIQEGIMVGISRPFKVWLPL